MRPIEFRGKCLHDGRWIYGYYSGIGGDCYIQFEEWYIEKVVLETVGQFTGLTDKNGTKIFEGDRVKVEGVKKSIIKYRNDLAAFIWESEFTWGLLANTNPDYLEVIGNIHEGAGEMNPEYNAHEMFRAEAKRYGTGRLLERKQRYEELLEELRHGAEGAWMEATWRNGLRIVSEVIDELSGGKK